MGELRPMIDEFLEALRKEGGFGYAALMGLVESGDKNAAEDIYEMAWEQLHTGPWNEVHSVWRDAFSLACYLLSNIIGNENGNVDQSVKILDMGLIMGGLMFRPYLESAMSSARVIREPELEISVNLSVVNDENPHDCSEATRGCFKGSDYRKTSKPPSDYNGAGKVRVEYLPTLETFAQKYFIPENPVVIRNAMSEWPAVSKWKNMEYFRRLAGNRTVPVEVGEHYLASGWRQELMSIKELIDRICSIDTNVKKRPYLAQYSLFDQIPELKKDYLVPDYCGLGGGEMKSINAWFGPLGTVSPLHHDPHHNILAQVVGKKYLKLFSPSYTEQLYPFSEAMLKNSSQVDVREPNLEKFPEYEKARGLDCFLEEGDMVYIPPHWWHFVESLSLSFSVSFWWTVASET